MQGTPSTTEHDAGDGLSAAEMARQAKLKAIVIGLGILILLAFAGVIVGMVYRAGQIGNGSHGKAMLATPSGSGAARSGAAGADTAVSLAPFQAQIRLSVPPGSAVRAATLSGTRLVVHHEGPAGAGLTILDLTTGQVVSRITIEAERGR